MAIDVSKEAIGKFLEGRNPQKYIVAIEATYYSNNVDLIINDPCKGKYIVTDTYKPFIWMRYDAGAILYGGDRIKTRSELNKAGIILETLRTKNDNGISPDRVANGYKFILTGKSSYNNLLKFLTDGGADVFGEHKDLFMTLSPVEQYMVQTGKRLFKGFDDYNDVHRLQFDIETTGLDPKVNSTFLIGIKDNRGFEEVIRVSGDTPRELRESEIKATQYFLKLVKELEPDIISGYNSEVFDFNFLNKRCERLGYEMKDFGGTLNDDKPIYFRKNATIKLGAETEYYDQTIMWGFNVIDIAHAVRKAQAINSSIKGWGLKYITKFSDVAKPNRVYIQGDSIHKVAADIGNDYAFNETDGSWYRISEERPIKDGYSVVKGSFIVDRYLLDDLWETEKIDYIYNQASFLLSKLLPTSFSKTSTMGTASIWKIIMIAWSYENHLAIPLTDKKRDFTGGLSRLLEVGFAETVAKLDYAALYPNTQLTNNISPDVDITNAMLNMLLYIAECRDEFKELKNVNGKLAETETDKDLKYKYESLKSLYDKKQLPLKILANSFFGSFGAPYLFNWGDTDCAEETTCRGRQYFRLLLEFYKNKGFTPLVGDSVTHDTPIYLMDRKGLINILPISDLFDSESKFLDEEKLRDYSEKHYKILTRNGWKEIKYVYRHGTDKKIHKLSTRDRLVCVTEDHSVFANEVQVKPSTLNRGDKIDTYELPFSNKLKDIDLDVAWMYGFFLGDGSATNAFRYCEYKSRVTGEIKINSHRRCDWKISNTNLEFLNKLQGIIKDKLNIETSIKDHMKSSSVYNLVSHNNKLVTFFADSFYTNYREKKIPKEILNASREVKKSFINGVFASDGYGNSIDECSEIGMKSQVAMAGISLLIKEIGLPYKLKTRSDKENYNSFVLKNRHRNNGMFDEKATIMKYNEIWKNEIVKNPNKDNFVYDISTEDGTFIGGIGGIILKNTDGINFSLPKNIDEFKYTSTGVHRFNVAGKEYTGLDACVAEFNDVHMKGRMGLDVDEIAKATINFARKNYADLLINKKGKTKVKLVGNTIKSKKMPGYIEDFLDKAVVMLLDNNGYDFVELYYNTVNNIYTYQIPVSKIASKARIKQTVEAYKLKSFQKNKNGKPLPKQAHMELIMRDNIPVNLGDTVYYVNTGAGKSHGDLQSKKNKETGKTELILNCKLISNEQLENNPDLTTDEYNVPKYLTAFNKRIKPLLVCFHPDVRDSIMIDIVKDKKTKQSVLQDRQYFTKKQLLLCAGLPFKPEDQDTYEDLMRMEDKEIYFWLRVEPKGLVPNDIEPEEFKILKDDYIKRMINKRSDDSIKEAKIFDNVLKTLEVGELSKISNLGILPDRIKNIVEPRLVGEDVHLFSLRLKEDSILGFNDVDYGDMNDLLFKYEDVAIKRDEYYKTIDLSNINLNEVSLYDIWLAYAGETLDLGLDISILDEPKEKDESDDEDEESDE